MQLEIYNLVIISTFDREFLVSNLFNLYRGILLKFRNRGDSCLNGFYVSGRINSTPL